MEAFEQFVAIYLEQQHVIRDAIVSRSFQGITGEQFHLDWEMTPSKPQDGASCTYSVGTNTRDIIVYHSQPDEWKTFDFEGFSSPTVPMDRGLDFGEPLGVEHARVLRSRVGVADQLIERRVSSGPRGHVGARRRPSPRFRSSSDVRRTICERIHSGERAELLTEETGIAFATLFRWKYRAHIDAGLDGDPQETKPLLRRVLTKCDRFVTQSDELKVFPYRELPTGSSSSSPSLRFTNVALTRSCLYVGEECSAETPTSASSSRNPRPSRAAPGSTRTSPTSNIRALINWNVFGVPELSQSHNSRRHRAQWPQDCERPESSVACLSECS